MFISSIISIVCLFVGTARGQNEFGEIVFQEALRWNYTYMNPTCTAADGGRNPCSDIRICTFAVASLAMGGWPTLCGWVGKGVPKVCCGLPLVLGPGLLKKDNEEKARKRKCGTSLYPAETEITKRLFAIQKTLPKVDTSDPSKFDPPLDLEIKPMLIPSSVYTGSQQGKFSWMVSVRRHESHVCGGSLIDRRHILTAASCVLDNKEQYNVHVGNLHIDDGYMYTVKKISIHPEYQDGENSKNLAILTLSEEILSPNVAHICLVDPSSARNMNGMNTTLLQWDEKIRNDEKRPYLNVVDGLTVVSTEECQRNYEKCKNGIVQEQLDEDFICVIASKESDLKLTEDVGGPLMYRKNSVNQTDSTIPWTILAVDTVGHTCGNKFLMLLTRVSSHINWIENIMNEQ